MQVCFQYKGKWTGSKKINKSNTKDKSHEHKGRDSSDREKKNESLTRRRWGVTIVKSLVILPNNVGIENGLKISQKNQANLAQDDTSDYEAVMLMAKTSENQPEDTSWYLGSNCLTPMTKKK